MYTHKAKTRSNPNLINKALLLVANLHKTQQLALAAIHHLAIATTGTTNQPIDLVEWLLNQSLEWSSAPKKPSHR